MIARLASLLPDFDGPPNRVRCFAHVLNLVAKSLIRQFDADIDKEAAAQGADERELAELAELTGLADGLAEEEEEAQAGDALDLDWVLGLGQAVDLVFLVEGVVYLH